MALAVIDVVRPTTIHPAATPALMPVRESSKTIQRDGGRPTLDAPSRYGSGCGFARAHSAPTTRSRIADDASGQCALTCFNTASQPPRCAFETAQHGIFSARHVVKKDDRPGTMAQPSLATRAQKSRSFSLEAAFARASSTAPGSTSLNTTESTLPATCSANQASSTRSVIPSAAIKSWNAFTYNGSVRASVPSMSRRHAADGLDWKRPMVRSAVAVAQSAIRWRRASELFCCTASVQHFGSSAAASVQHVGSSSLCALHERFK
mmetsp:Transcript_24930/g.64745  ORF Transcript_24930/g.64745 Transcript_24930/m.64745 type:complete len:264 (-) Transcript_24930:42-833(-)